MIDPSPSVTDRLKHHLVQQAVVQALGEIPQNFSPSSGRDLGALLETAVMNAICAFEVSIESQVRLINLHHRMRVEQSWLTPRDMPIFPEPTCEHCGCKMSRTLGGLENHKAGCPNFPL